LHDIYYNLWIFDNVHIDDHIHLWHFDLLMKDAMVPLI